MNERTHLTRALPWALALGLVASWSMAQAADPILAPGAWSYHADIHYQSGAMATGDLHRDWTVCVRPGETQLPTAMPKTPGLSCDKPSLTSMGRAFHVTMTCTARGQGNMSSTMREDFTITPSADKTKVSIDGSVHQSISGLPIAMPETVTTVLTTGERTGACTASG